jgi:hypothetical protein
MNNAPVTATGVLLFFHPRTRPGQVLPDPIKPSRLCNWER